MRELIISLLVLLIAILFMPMVSADSAPPYDFDCLKSINLWEQVQGKWEITNGVFKHAPAGFDKIAILKPEGVNIPGWYNVTVLAEGLNKAQEQSVSIVFGYRSVEEYWVCTYEQREKQSNVSVQRILKGVPDISVDTPLIRDPSDRINLQLGVQHGEATYMSAGVDHRTVVHYRHPGELPRRCGVLAHSSSVTINQYIISGIAKR
jgi:hypothetical protein